MSIVLVNPNPEPVDRVLKVGFLEKLHQIKRTLCEIENVVPGSVTLRLKNRSTSRIRSHSVIKLSEEMTSAEAVRPA